jgi:hypothetical protein
MGLLQCLQAMQMCSGKARPSLTRNSDDVIWNEEAFQKALDALERSAQALPERPLSRALPLPPAADPEFLKSAMSWDFDLFTLPYSELAPLAYQVLMAHTVIADPSHKYELKKLWRYTCEIAGLYHQRPFHNFRHAVDVLLATSSLLKGVQNDHPDTFEDPIVVAALLVSALVHDTDHPGVMNTYLIASNHELAVRRGEEKTAVLETHHANMAIAVLGQPQCDFLCKLAPERRAEFIRLVRENVLSTDVTTTMTKAKQFQSGGIKGRRPSQSVENFARRTSKIATEEPPLREPGSAQPARGPSWSANPLSP